MNPENAGGVQDLSSREAQAICCRYQLLDSYKAEKQNHESETRNRHDVSGKWK